MEKLNSLSSRTDKPGVVCAVPEDRPVPDFIRGLPWRFAGRLHDRDIASLDFNREAAEKCVRYNGFYLFQMIRGARGESGIPETPPNAITDNYQPYVQYSRGKLLLRLQKCSHSSCLSWRF